MRSHVLIIAWLFIAIGCTETRTEKETQIERNDDVHLSGSISLPIPDGQGGIVPMPIPIDITVERIGTESQSEKGQQETKINANAIGQQIGATASAALKSALASMTGIKLPESKAGGGITAAEGTLATGLTAAAGWALKEMLERRGREKILEQVKQARDSAQAQALKYAEKVDPKNV